MIDVGERLKELMEARGLNMNTLSKKSGLSWNTIKNFYSRKSIPTVTTISMLCDGLGISLAQFFDVDGDQVHLTAEQQRVINRWDALTDREKEVIDGMMDIALESRNPKE